MTTPYTIECTVHLCRQGRGGKNGLRTDQPARSQFGPLARSLRGGKNGLQTDQPARPTQLAVRVPRLARLMALALRFDKLLAAGVVKDFRTLARLGHVSPARISQIVSLLHLAPDLQEALLFRERPERGRDGLDLRKVLPLTKVWDWHKQRRMWRGLASQQSPRHGANVAL